MRHKVESNAHMPESIPLYLEIKYGSQLKKSRLTFSCQKWQLLKHSPERAPKRSHSEWGGLKVFEQNELIS